jgi:hypothetical protein
MGILDGAREFNSVRIGALAGGATVKLYFYIADETILTDIGFVESQAITAGSNYLTVAAQRGCHEACRDGARTPGASASGLVTNSTHVVAGLSCAAWPDGDRQWHGIHVISMARPRLLRRRLRPTRLSC